MLIGGLVFTHGEEPVSQGRHMLLHPFKLKVWKTKAKKRWMRLIVCPLCVSVYVQGTALIVPLHIWHSVYL